MCARPSAERRAPITYNFDPDRWFEIHKALLKKKLLDDRISREMYDKAVEELEKRYHEMWKRLDGSYQIPE